MPSDQILAFENLFKHSGPEKQPDRDLSHLSAGIWQKSDTHQHVKIEKTFSPASEHLIMHPIVSATSAKTESELQAKIAEVASHAAGKKMYLPRAESPYKHYEITPPFGCTSSSTNLFFDGLKAAGRVSDVDYKNVHQIANEKAYVMLQKEHLAKPVATKDIQPGDWIYCKDKGEPSGHSGVVFRDKKGELMVANNTSGKMMNDPLKEMIDDYDTTRALRPILAGTPHLERQTKPVNNHKLQMPDLNFR